MTFLRLCALLCLLPAVLPAPNYVFVFHSGSSSVTVYDGDTMGLVAQPQVGQGATRAFGVPNPSNPSQFLKYYVVTTSSIVVLNSSLGVRTTLSLPGALASGPNAAVLTPDGKRLLVAAGSQVVIVNTTEETDAIATAITMQAPPVGIAVLPNSRRAYVMLGVQLVQIIDLVPTPPQLLSTAVSIPGLPTAIGVAPNGSRVWVATAGAFYDIDRFSNLLGIGIPVSFAGTSSIAFDQDPPVASAVLIHGFSAGIVNLLTRTTAANPFLVSTSTTITKVVVPGANSAFLLAGGRVYRGFLSLGGPPTEVAAQFGPTVTDLEATPDGLRLFMSHSDAKLVRLDPSGSTLPVQVGAPLAATGLSLVYSPGIQVGQFEIYGGNNQTGPASTSLPAPLAVRARASNPHPAFGQTVTFSSSTSGVVFSDAIATTNLAGVAETQVTLPVSTAVAVTATISSGGFTSTQTFSLNGTVSGGEGLTKVSGDLQMVVAGTAFNSSLVVRAVANGVPQPSITLSISGPTASVSCPLSVTTNAEGLASFDCSALATSSKTSAEISVGDSAGRSLPEPFRIVIVPSESDLPTSLVFEDDSTLEVTVRQTITDGVTVRAAKANGTVVNDVGVVFSSSPPGVIFSPETKLTDGGGRATASLTFGCYLGSGTLRAVALTPSPSPVGSRPFRTTRGPVAQLAKRQGDNQRGNPGQLLTGQALVVVAGDLCGNGAAGESVGWRVEPAGAATLENVFSTTDLEGRSSVLVRLGTRPGPFTVIASLGTLTATFNLAVNIQATRLVTVAGNNQTVAAGQTSQPLVAEVQDDNGVGAAGVEVSFIVTAGSGTLSASRVATDAQGRASVRFTAGTSLGSATVQASAIGRTVSFTLTIVGRVPVVTSLGFVNGASFRLGWVPGSLGSIFGVRLMEGITGVVQADRAPFPTTLRGVRVRVNDIEAPLISLVNIQGQEQINLQVPASLSAPGSVTVVIDNNGSQATFSGVPLFAVQPGIFEFESGGVRLAAVLHLDFSVVTQSNPARRGEILLLFLTGLGRTTPALATNVAGPVPPAETVTRPIVGLNDQGAEVLGAWYAPGFYTLYQINFRVRDDAASGLAKLAVVADGAASQDSRLPIQ